MTTCARAVLIRATALVRAAVALPTAGIIVRVACPAAVVHVDGALARV